MRAIPAAACLSILIFTGAAWAKQKHVTPPVLVEAPAPDYPAELLAEGAEGAVEMIFSIDENGAAQEVRAEHWTDERFKEPCVEAAQRWKFQAKTSKGRPKDRVWYAIIEFREGRVAVGKLSDRSAVRVPPKVLEQEPPEYPEELASSWNAGKVDIRFIVDEEGKVRDPVVVTSTHPAFEMPAIAALLQWKFEPGTFAGRPVRTRMQVPIRFDMCDPKGVEAFEMRKKSAKNVPEALKIDVAPKPKVTVFAVHPYEHVISGTTGTAEVKVLVGKDGTVIASVIEKASKPEFGLALAAAMEAWTFDPALRDKKPAIAAVSRKFTFEKRDRDSAIDDGIEAIARRIRKGAFEPAKAKDLDSPIRPKFTTLPVYPTALRERGINGSAKIEVIVDKNGRAVLPRIIEASEPAFGWAAATAVQRWRFDPPTVGKKPVEVKVVIPVKFTPPEVDESAQ